MRKSISVINESENGNLNYDLIPDKNATEELEEIKSISVRAKRMILSIVSSEDVVDALDTFKEVKKEYERRIKFEKQTE